MAKILLEEMAKKPAPWLSGNGPDSAVVLSSRIRLARNISDFPFPPSASSDIRERIIDLMQSAFSRIQNLKKGTFFRSGDIDNLHQMFLAERHLISPQFMIDGGGRGLFIDDKEKISIMLNEEDHIRLQVLSSGMSLHECWDLANKVDDEIGRILQFDYDEEFGFLTACPTNVGTGLRASLLIHLPGLVLTREIDNVINRISKVGLMVRGFYGEGTDVLGNLFQIANQTTLGRTEDEVIDSLTKISAQIIEYERGAQETLMKDAPEQIEDKVWRSYGILMHARVLTSNEVMNLLSALRLGLSLSLIDKFDFRTLNELLIITQPAHLQKYVGREMDTTERDMVRADLIRQRLADFKQA
ncbi:MAG: protein arginine kinase [candidate division Zixibacteria bacterium RBG_16_53_22]|nr:MAG: protein arginine kinase [candidate division Zixibacteria bacterium RBG_16_53_22]